MKKIRHFLCLAAGIGTAATAGAQMYQHGNLTVLQNASMVHDSAQCGTACSDFYVITVQNASANDTVWVIDEGGQSLIFSQANTTGNSTFTTTTTPIPVIPFVADNQLMNGQAFFYGPTVKVIAGQDTIHNIPNSFSYTVTNPCSYGMAGGRVYIDNDADCQFTAGDVPLQYLQVSNTTNLNSPAVSSTAGSAYTDGNGQYSMEIQESWMTDYSVYLPPMYQFIFPAPTCAPVTYNLSTLPATNVDFILHCSSNVDVQTAALAPATVRPLQPFLLSPYVSNTGCDSASGTLTLTLDPNVTYNAALSSNPATGVNGNTLTWNYSNLTNLSNGAYFNSFFAGVYLTPNNNAGIGDSLCFTITATAPGNDINTGNNSYSICLPVVAAYDPNVKEVMPKGEGPDGDIPAGTPSLTYTIHFQNTGTAAAYNVTVVDTLDAALQPAGLKVLGSSATVIPQWPAPNVIQFNFYNINLPDSGTNEAASHGAVRFSVPLTGNLPVNSRIYNKAAIYFDANPPVVTNTTVNTIAPLGVANVMTGASGLRLYPVPANERLTIDAGVLSGMQDAFYTIVAADGRTVYGGKLMNGKAIADLHALPAGWYYLNVTGAGKHVAERFTKQ